MRYAVAAATVAIVTCLQPGVTYSDGAYVPTQQVVQLYEDQGHMMADAISPRLQEALLWIRPEGFEIHFRIFYQGDPGEFLFLGIRPPVGEHDRTDRDRSHCEQDESGANEGFRYDDEEAADCHGEQAPDEVIDPGPFRSTRGNAPEGGEDAPDDEQDAHDLRRQGEGLVAEDHDDDCGDDPQHT